MQAKTIAQRMQGFSNQKFGCRVFAPDFRHHPGAGFYIECISQEILRTRD